ncbi:hypothetical protein HN709_05320 [Candidatus Peregrinibacteria bacterium]|jgi:hypothetical protein|nr:hypothetical protein [Candidatus Peregrinibacteria bacterium]MBT7737077.1 hypothetical protein [Candidatus Peregrinibacteria bacterium]
MDNPSTQPDETKIQLHPTPESEKMKAMEGNKGLFFAIVVGVIVVAIGASALIGFKSSTQYQGLIEKIETQTKNLEEYNDGVVR